LKFPSGELLPRCWMDENYQKAWVEILKVFH
jgi:hypothetical protein